MAFATCMDKGSGTCSGVSLAFTSGGTMSCGPEKDGQANFKQAI